MTTTYKSATVVGLTWITCESNSVTSATTGGRNDPARGNDATHDE